MNFKGTEGYRRRASGIKEWLGGQGYLGGFERQLADVAEEHQEEIVELCDYIDKQQKHVEQLKTHLDNYAEVIGKKQQENAELRVRVEELEQALEHLVTYAQEGDEFTDPGDPERYAALYEAEITLWPERIDQ